MEFLNSPLLVCVILLFFSQSGCTINCLDGSGKSVDWYFMYKVDKNQEPYGGFTYVYTDSSIYLNGKFVMGDLRENSNPIARTIEQIGLYGSTVDYAKVGWAIWNDETYDTLKRKKRTNHEQDKDGKYYAHSKGTIGFDSDTGFWLTHSSPDGNIPVSLKSSMPFLSTFIAGEYQTGHSSIKFKSLGGEQFVSIGKNGALQADLYEDLVAPKLKANLLVETWCCGSFGTGECCQPSYCKGNPITDPSGPQKHQKHYLFNSITLKSLNFKEYNLNVALKWNHAKFALADPESATASYSYNSSSFRDAGSSNSARHWFCASDINRMTHQRLRGGGAVCFNNYGFYSMIIEAATGTTTCGSK